MARYNRNVNPAFYSNTTGWTSSGLAAALRRISSARGDGVAGYIGDGNTTGASAVIQTTNSGGGLAPVVAGQQYTVSVYVYQGSGSTKNVRVDADQANSSGTYTSTWGGAGPTVAVPSGTWTRITQTNTVSAGSAYLSTYITFSVGSGVYIAVSCAMVEDGPVSPNYRDGNSSGWAWTGTAGNSQSRNLDPTASAGADLARTSGDTVNLSGSGSADPEGATISYAWTVQDAAGTGLTNANITNRLTAFPYFTAPAVTGAAKAITLRLTVTDPEGNTGTDDVVVTVSAPYLIDYTGTGGLVISGAADYAYNRGNDVTGDGGLVAGGAADVLRTLSEVVSGAGGLSAGGSADLLFITPTFVTGSGGLSGGGTAVPPLFITPTFVTGSGGLLAGGDGEYRYRAASVPAGVTIEWDLDGDGHFTRPEETVTPFVISVETLTGRDYPSQLTGRAGPGKLRVELLNQDNRFSHFNQASPLNNGGMSLQVGSRIRLRTIESVNPDPTRLAWDDFERGPFASSLGTSDSGHVWTGTYGLQNHRATPTGTGLNLATIDVGAADHYVQATVGNVGVGFTDGTGNVVAIVYRYVNASNYSRLQYNVATWELRVVDRVAGADTNRGYAYVEPYDGMVLGAYVTGSSVTWYLDGAEMGVDTAGVAGGTRCGLYAVSPAAHATPWADDVAVWDKPAATATGILWTGYVADITESVELGPVRKVTVDAEGPLAQAADTEIYPTSSPYGRSSGTIVGNTLARAGMLDPPGPIEYGDFITGAFGYEKSKALEVCRDFEEAELGFLYETQEGRIGFDHRTARDGRTSQAVFADFEGAQLGYHKLEPRDWRREIVNRVEAGIAGTAPRGNQNYVWTNYAEIPSPLVVPPNYGVFWIRPSDAPVPITKGQLLIVMVAAPRMIGWTGTEQVPGTVHWCPLDWTVLDGQGVYTYDSRPGAGDNPVPLRLYAKVAEGNENQPIVFGYIRGDSGLSYPSTTDWYGETYDAIARPPYIVSMYNVDNFFGDIKEGVKVSEIVTTGTDLQTSAFEAPTVFPDWGPDHPSLFVTALSGHSFEFWNSGAAVLNGINPPDGYQVKGSSPVERQRNGGSTSDRQSVFLAWADAYGSRSVESPTPWKGSVTSTGVGDYGVRTVTIAVRGKNGDPPIKNGHVTVTRDDLASQKKYNTIRTHREESNLFQDETVAEDYADLVLARYSGERPIMALSFWANTTIAHRAQAITRRVGDRITVESDNATGLNYSGDYFIESISHKIDSGGKRWEVTWELSPV